MQNLKEPERVREGGTCQAESDEQFVCVFTEEVGFSRGSAG